MITKTALHFLSEKENGKNINKMMSSDLFCMKNELSNFKEVFQEPQTSEKLSSDHVVLTYIKCDICNSLFKTKEKLKRHIESVHDRKKPFKCNVCDACFTRNGDLNAHKVSVLERTQSISS